VFEKRSDALPLSYCTRSTARSRTRDLQVKCSSSCIRRRSVLVRARWTTTRARLSRRQVRWEFPGCEPGSGFWSPPWTMYSLPAFAGNSS